jgi:hypothetical protein
LRGARVLQLVVGVRGWVGVGVNGCLPFNPMGATLSSTITHCSPLLWYRATTAGSACNTAHSSAAWLTSLHMLRFLSSPLGMSVGAVPAASQIAVLDLILVRSSNAESGAALLVFGKSAPACVSVCGAGGMLAK